MVQVSNHSELISALNSASPSDTIECFEGNYDGNIDDIVKTGYVNIVAASGQFPDFGFKRIRRNAFLNFYGIQFNLGGLYVNAQGDPDGGSIVNAENNTNMRYEACHSEGRDKCWKFTSEDQLEMVECSFDKAGQGGFTFDGLTNSILNGLHGGYTYYMHPAVHGDFGQFSGNCSNNEITRWRYFGSHRFPPELYPGGSFPTDQLGHIIQFVFMDNGSFTNFHIHNNLGSTNAVGLIWEGASASHSGHTVEYNTCLSMDGINIPTIGGLGGATKNNNIAGAGGQITVAGDRSDYSLYYQNAHTGVGPKTIQDFAIVPGPAEMNGAFALINELLGGTPPMGIVYSLETQATNGTTNVNPDGTWTYDPNTNFAGSDSWQYRATDDVFNTFSIGTMTGNVIAPVPNAPDGSFSTDANTQASGDLTTL